MLLRHRSLLPSFQRKDRARAVEAFGRLFSTSSNARTPGGLFDKHTLLWYDDSAFWVVLSLLFKAPIREKPGGKSLFESL